MKVIRTIVLMLIVAGVAIVADRTYRARTSPSSAEWIEDAKFDNIIIDHLQFDRQPLASALRKLSEKSGVGIVLDSERMEQSDLETDPPVNLVLDHVTFSEALRMTLHSVHSDNSIALDFSLERGNVLVSTADEIQRHPMLRIYRIDDIVDAILKTNLPDPREAISVHQPQNLFAGGSLGPVVRQDAVDCVVKLIEDSVCTDSWQDNGGISGKIRDLNGRLIIVQTWRAHQDIARLFRQIHGAAQTTPPAAGAR